MGLPEVLEKQIGAKLRFRAVLAQDLDATAQVTNEVYSYKKQQLLCQIIQSGNSIDSFC